MTSVRRADREQVLAFRLAGHNLSERRPLADLLDVAGACGIRNTPPGSAPLALNARLAGLTLACLDGALGDERSLVEVLGMRISPHLVPVRDVGVFTRGALPREEDSLRGALNALSASLDRAGISATAALERATDAAWVELEDGPLAKSALSAGMTRRLPEPLSPFCKPCGSAHVLESLFRLAGVAGAFVLTRVGRQGLYARLDQWLRAAQDGDSATLRAELLRRYLRCFGPSTATDFAAWVGIGQAEARQDWERISDHLAVIELDGRRAWLHADDLASFESPPDPTGVRLLPPYDAYLDQRDRQTLLPDPALHRRVWAALGNPGVVLLDGAVAGIWRPKKAGRRFTITVESFAPLSPSARPNIEAEAALLAPLRECTAVQVTFDT